MFWLADRSRFMGYAVPGSDMVATRQRTAPHSVIWSEAIERHDHKVFASLLALAIPPDRARELCQATWARLLEQDGRGELPHLELPGLAIRQARFLALDDLRRRGVEKRRLEDTATIAEVVSGPDPEAQIASRQRLARALAALATCSPTAQSLFRMLYVPPGLSQEEAATQLGLSLQRVRQILCETRKHIRRAVDEEGAR
jgi:RNA polymerase sigma-70 factor (ECF subfamily)